MFMEEDIEKQPRLRSRLYPRYNLEDAIEFIEAISKLGGTRVSTQAVAAETGKSVNNSGFAGRVSSSKQFGLILQESGKLSLSPLGKAIIFPIGESEKAAAIKQAFATPPLYKEVIDAFNGKILDRSTLGNRLVHDYGIEAAARDRAARNFVNSAEYASVMQNGILVAPTDDNLIPTQEEVTPPTTPPSGAKSQTPTVETANHFVFDFSGGIKLVIPRNEQTSDAIADGALKDIREGLRGFASEFMSQKPARGTSETEEADEEKGV